MRVLNYPWPRLLRVCQYHLSVRLTGNAGKPAIALGRQYSTATVRRDHFWSFLLNRYVLAFTTAD